MRSRTSFFNASVFRVMLTHNWPLWAAYGLFMFFLTPLSMMGSRSSDFGLVSSAILSKAWSVGAIIAFIMAALTAMCVYGFMYSTRQTGLFSSLPVNREAVYVSAFLAGFVAMTAVDVLIFLITIVVELQLGMLAMNYLWMWLGITVMLNLTFYGFAAFCAMLTGNIIVLPLVYAVLSIVAWVVELLVRELLKVFVFGMASGGHTFMWMSPIVKIMSYSPVAYVSSSTGVSAVLSIPGSSWRLLGIYCAVGVVFAVLGLLLYRRRRMETATDVVAIRILKPVFKYCMTLGCALVFGVWLVSIVFGLGYSPKTMYIVVAFMLVGAFIGYFAADMLMKKTFRVFSGNWKGFVIAAAVMVALVLCCRFDLFRYETHVPDASDVESVTIYASAADGNVDLRQTDNIALVTALHSSIVANKSVHSQDVVPTVDTKINYILKNGRSISRFYSINSSESQAQDKTSDVNKLQEVLNVQEAISFRKNVSVEVVAKNINYASIDYYDAATGTYLNYELSSDEAAQLYKDCIKPDIDAGTLGRIWLNTDEEYDSKVYAMDISIDLRKRSEGQENAPDETAKYDYAYLHTTLTSDSTRTLQWILSNTNLKPVLSKDAGNGLAEKNGIVAETTETAPAATAVPVG